MRVFTLQELLKYDGSNGIAYVAYRGKVYDLSTSFHWRTGIHHAKHPSGCDLTEALDKEAPHGASLLKKFPIVGELK